MQRHLQLLTLFVAICVLNPAYGQPLDWEDLDRGLVAIQTDQGVFLSWRLLFDDASDVAFDLWRGVGTDKVKKLNDQPLRGSTTFLDAAPPASGKVTYGITRTSAPGGITEPQAKNQISIDLDQAPFGYLEIPTEIPSGYHANDASAGDLDGDGSYELVVHVAGRGHDNSRGGMTDPPLFHAYTLDGQRLWQINLGKNVREGAHYNPFLVFDFDGDGHAEFVCRTSDGTVDGRGQAIGDPSADWRVPLPVALRAGEGSTHRRRLPGDVGKILSGPEYMTVFDGRTGAALDTVTYLPQRAPDNDNPSRELQKQVWGDDYGNRMDRFLAAVAFLDGKHPSIVMSRGYYTRTVIAAWDFRDGQIQKRWLFDSDEVNFDGHRNPWAGQGNHSISVADVDNDGRDEIVFGSMVVDDDGTGLYSTNLGHGDAQHTGDLDPRRPGLETWSIHESNRPEPDFIGSELRDAETGRILFVGRRGRDVARGMAADIDPRYPGAELWGGSRDLWTANGKVIGPAPRSTNMAIWWDGDRLRELLDGVRIEKWDHLAHEQRLLFDGPRAGVVANNGSKNNPCLAADLIGDWREELVARSADNQALRIYVSTIPTQHRQVTLMQDRQYRLGIAWQNVGYNQPPHTRDFIGAVVHSKPK
ncbi:Rhamnogalacturonan endolyase YesW precursor [Crateriforma conspicua]|uniref:Rhamnogalacturonan endolyase YesW n=1 Tax=Crateriforma conspicua TaxID=2527996 RepID=A0A5C6FNE7_9PLAN|nr:rhamnogalacturonan lyase [Crateriforma conspicua]TWU62168.1 Rhamnogalacturonan endolyase YesW precursor [Crateriforma conspicua]